MLKLILLLILACKSCGPYDYTAWGIWWDINSISTIKVYIDTVFPSYIRDAIIENVINMWNSHTQDPCGFSVQYTDDWSSSNIRIGINPSFTDIDNRFDAIAKTRKLCFNHTTGELWHSICHPCIYIYVAPLNILESHNIDLYTVLRHEMGHALGLWHTENSDCLMYKYYLDPRDIGTGEQNGLICIYGSLFGERVKPSAGSDTKITPLDRRHVSIKIIQGACNGDGMRGADSAKVKMNFYHGDKDMSWETIDSFNYASRYYEDSITVELPPDDSNYTGWRVIKSYVYFPDTVIVNVSDTFDFNALSMEERGKDSANVSLRDIKVKVSSNIVSIKNMTDHPIMIMVYNILGQLYVKPLTLRGSEEKAIAMKKGLYFIRVKYTDGKGQVRIYVNPS